MGFINLKLVKLYILTKIKKTFNQTL
jgi:hypothetical protein